MKYLKWALGLAAFALVSVFGVSAVAQAQRFSTNIDEGDVVNSSVYSAGQTVSIKGEIHGDIFCAGRTVDIDAIVHGDVICAGQDVTIAGTIDGDIRVAGQNVSISASVRNNVTAAGSQISLDAPAEVGQDVTALGNLLNIKGSIGRDLLLSGTDGIVNGAVKRDVRYDGTALELKSDARIGGSLTYTSASDVTKADGATVAGTTKHNQPEKKNSNRLSFSPGWYVVALIALALVSVVIAFIAPRTLHTLTDSIGSLWLKPLLVGIGGSLLMPLIAFMLMVTVIGIPLGALVLLLWVLLLMLSGPVAAYWVGQRLLSKHKSIPLRALAGSIVVVTLYFVPFIGFFVLLTTYWVGSGVILLAAKRRLGKPRYLAE